MNALIINLAGAPGAGKSTGAAYIFAKLKMAGINAELVTEFAKDKVWEENPTVFRAQDYIFAKQHFRLLRCVGKCDVIVTDAPLPLSVFYNTDEKLAEAYEGFVMGVFAGYRNCNYLIRRSKPYNPVGRFQNEQESDRIAEKMRQFYVSRGIPFDEVNGTQAAYDGIVDDILARLREGEC